jgi:hypothetical protein
VYPWKGPFFSLSHFPPVMTNQWASCKSCFCPLLYTFLDWVFLYPFSLGPMTTFLVRCPHNQAYSWTHTLQPWRRKQHVSLKCRYPPTELHGVMTVNQSSYHLVYSNISILCPQIFMPGIWRVTSAFGDKQQRMLKFFQTLQLTSSGLMSLGGRLKALI